MYFCKMNVWIDIVSDALWGWCLIFVLIGCALWFTLRSRGVQFRMIGEMFRLLGESTQKKDGQHRVSSFQAFAPFPLLAAWEPGTWLAWLRPWR